MVDPRVSPQEDACTTNGGLIMAPICPKCGAKMSRGNTINFTDLARVIVKRHICKACNQIVFTDADTGTIIRVV